MNSISISTCILLTLFFTSLSKSEHCNPQDKSVLFKIKASLNDPYHLASWTNTTDCCHWYCVECHPITNRINSLTIFQAQISAHIPSQVGDLDSLETLVFRHITNVTGPIPPSISRLTRLKMLRLSWLNISGPVPGFLSLLKSLTYLDLSFNSLSGTIPGELGTLPNLGAIHLDRNSLIGSIPDKFGDFGGSSPDLHLSHNLLTGNVPISLGKLNSSVIDLSRNRLSGDVSFLFGENKAAFEIDVSRNLLEFDLSKVAFPKGLGTLDISHNKIYGGFPKDSVGIGFQRLNVSYNRLCGPIPAGGRLQKFDAYSYFHNKCLCSAPLEGCKSH